MQNWHGNGIPEGKPIDFGALLKQLISPNAPDASTAQGALGPATLTQLGNSGNSTADAIGPYQQGVAKALKDFGQKHVQDAVAAGADPIADIQNHPVMNYPSPSVDPTQILAGVVANHLANQQEPTNSQSNNNYNYKPDNPISSFFNMLGITPTPEAQVLLTQAAMNRQKIAAGQPADIALPQAQADYSQKLSQQVQQKMLGQEPIQPSDIATIKANVNKLNFDALNASSQRLDADMKTRQDAIEASQKTINLMGQIGGLFSGTGTTITPVVKQLEQEIQNIKKVKAKVDAQISNFNPPNPLGNQSSGFTEGATYKDANGNTAVYKNGKFQ